MADINEILGRQINSVKELKAAIKELQDSLVGVDAESEQFKTTSEQLAAAQAELNKVTRAGKDDNNAAADSIRGMEQEYKKLYDTYKMLTEEQRNSDFGKNMAQSLEALSTKLNESKKEVGNFKDNIGRYAQSATEAFNGMGVSIGGLQTPLKLASGGAKTFGTALKTLAANPIVLVITALVAILVKAVEAIKKNEELTNRLKQAFSVFKPVLDAVSNAFDFLAGLLVKTVEGLSRVAEKVMSIIPGMKQAIQSHKDLEKATQNLTKATREANIENSKKQAEIERLREEASATEDVVEKKKLLEEAKALQAEVDQKNIELAQEELRIMEEYAAKTANSAEENEKLAAAQKKVNDAIAQGERNMRMYNKQLSATETKTKSAGGAAVDYRKKAQELYKQLIEDNKDEITKLTEKYEKEKKLLEKYHLDTTLLTKKYEKETAEIKLKNTQSFLANYASSLDKQKEFMQKYDELYEYVNGRLASINSQISALDTGARKRLNSINDAYNKLMEAFSGKPLEEVINTLFDDVDIKNATDFNAVLDAVEFRMNQLAVKFPEKSAKIKEAMEALIELGPNEWAKLVAPMQKTAMELEKINGITLNTVAEAGVELELLPKKIAELKEELKGLNINEITKLGEEAFGRVNERITTMTDGLYSSIFNILSNNDFEKAIWDYTSKFKAEIEYKQLELQKGLYEQELANFKGTQEQKIEMLQAYYGVVSEMEAKREALAELQQQRTMEMVTSLADMADQMGNALSTYRTSQEQLIDSQVKTGQIDEKEAKKKKKRLLDLQRVERDFAVATILADAASGIFSIWKGWSTEVGVINPQGAAAAGFASPAYLAALNAKSTISAAAKTAGLAATAAAQIAAAQNGYIAAKNNFMSESEGGGGGVSVGATPAMIDSTPYSYTRTLQTQEEEDRLNQPIYVTVTDIEEGLGHRATVTNESSF